MKKLFILLPLMLLLCACTNATESSSVDLSKFEIVNHQLYARDGKKCLAYRVVVSSEVSDDELFAAARSVLDDGYYLHTVWFFHTFEDVDRADTFATIDQKTEDTLTLIKNGKTVEQRPVEE